MGSRKRITHNGLPTAPPPQRPTVAGRRLDQPPALPPVGHSCRTPTSTDLPYTSVQHRPAVHRPYSVRFSLVMAVRAVMARTARYGPLVPTAVALRTLLLPAVRYGLSAIIGQSAKTESIRGLFLIGTVRPCRLGPVCYLPYTVVLWRLWTIPYRTAQTVGYPSWLLPELPELTV